MGERELEAMLEEAVDVWLDRSDHGEPPLRAHAELAVVFMAALPPAERDPLGYVAVILAAEVQEMLGLPWRMFDPAAFAGVHVPGQIECDGDETVRMLHMLERFFAWLAAHGALERADLEVIAANLGAAREPRQEHGGIWYENVMPPGSRPG